MRVIDWPPRDWRMMLALLLLAVTGLGAWILNFWALGALITVAVNFHNVWPLAYYSYGTLGLLSIPSTGFAMVVGLKSFKATGPEGTSFEATGDTGTVAASVTTQTTVLTP